MQYQYIYDSPVGPLTLHGDGECLSGLYFDQASLPTLSVQRLFDATPFRGVITQLDAYFARKLRTFDVPLAPEGTAFQQRVWRALRDIPYGKTLSYGQLAAGIGNANASRAVGLANGRNPISIIVPCHRVIGANGTLTGYGGGLPRKRWLLRHEGVAVK